jgi:hypothetical protein
MQCLEHRLATGVKQVNTPALMRPHSYLPSRQSQHSEKPIFRDHKQDNKQLEAMHALLTVHSQHTTACCCMLSET